MLCIQRQSIELFRLQTTLYADFHMQRNVMPLTLQRRLGVPVGYKHAATIRRMFCATPLRRDETAKATAEKPTHAQRLAFLQSEDGRHLTAVETRLAHLREIVVRARELFQYPKLVENEALPSIPAYNVHRQSASAKAAATASYKVLERIDYLSLHLDDLKHEPYPIPGESREGDALQWERWLRRAEESEMEDQLLEVDLRVTGLRSQIVDSLKNLEKKAEQFDSKGKAGRKRVKLDLKTILASRESEKSSATRTFKDMKSDLAREKQISQAAPAEPNTGKMESSSNAQTKDEQTKKPADNQAVGKKKTLGSGLRDRMKQLEKAWSTSR